MTDARFVPALELPDGWSGAITVVVREGQVVVLEEHPDDVAPGAEEIGHRALVEHRHALLLRALDVLEHEPHSLRVRISRRRADDTPGQRYLARLRRELTRRHRGRTTAGERRVEEEHRQDRCDGESDHEPRR